MISMYLLVSCRNPPKKNTNTLSNTTSPAIVKADTADVDTNAVINAPEHLQPDEINRMYRAGKLFKHAKIKEAILIYDTLISGRPDNSFFYSSRAAGYYQIGKLDEAKNDCEQALKLNPANYYALYTQAEVLIYFNNYGPAIASLTRAVKAKSDYALAYNLRGVARGNMGDIANAKADLDQAVKINGADPSAYYNRALIYSKMNMPDSEIKDYEKALKIFARYTEARNNLGLLKEKYRKDYTGALQEFTEILKYEPTNAKAYYCRGRCNADLKNYKEAIADYNKAIKLKADYKVVYLNRAAAYEALKDVKSAQKDRSTAATLH